MTKQQKIDSLLDKVERAMARYDAENDTIPGTPPVTWADYQALDAIRGLLLIVKEQQAESEKPC